MNLNDDELSFIDSGKRMKKAYNEWIDNKISHLEASLKLNATILKDCKVSPLERENIEIKMQLDDELLAKFAIIKCQILLDRLNSKTEDQK